MPIEKGNILLSIARSTIASELGSSVSAPADALWLQEQGTTLSLRLCKQANCAAAIPGRR